MLNSRFLQRFDRLPVIIAEAGVNHNGKLETARELVFEAAKAGADIIKFQTFTADECASEYTPKAEYQNDVESSNQFELLKKLELPFSAFIELSRLAQSENLEFLSTPDGEKSLQCLTSIPVNALKIASGEVTNLPFLAMIAQTGIPVILSTGMSRLGEVEKAINCLQGNGCNDIVLLHCTSAYPAADQEINLRVLQTLRQAFGLPVGFSDHSRGIEAAIAATALGACLIEKHFTLDCLQAGPDHKASLDPKQFSQMVLAVRRTSMMLGKGMKRPTNAESENSPVVRRGVCAARNIAKGSTIRSEDLCCKRPAGNIEPEFLEMVTRRIALQDFVPDQPIFWNQLGKVEKIED